MEGMVGEIHGYMGKILRVDLSSGTVTHIPTMEYADRFLGGRGIAAKIYWDEVPPEVGAYDPENRLIIATGPLTGLSGQIGEILQDVKQVGDFKLKTVQVQVGISAEGGFVLIGKAGVKGAVTLTFSQ